MGDYFDENCRTGHVNSARRTLHFDTYHSHKVYLRLYMNDSCISLEIPRVAIPEVDADKGHLWLSGTCVAHEASGSACGPRRRPVYAAFHPYAFSANTCAMLQRLLRAVLRLSKRSVGSVYRGRSGLKYTFEKLIQQRQAGRIWVARYLHPPPPLHPRYSSLTCR